MHTDYVRAHVTVCTAYCALQIVMFTLQYTLHNSKTFHNFL